MGKTELGVSIYIMHQHVAASNGHEECVWVLLKYGCNIHVRGNLLVYISLSNIFLPKKRTYLFVSYFSSVKLIVLYIMYIHGRHKW